MKYFYLFFSLVFTCFVNAQIINFPDANFKAKLLQPYVAATNDMGQIFLDANNDGELEVSEVDNVWQLVVSNANISDLTGIEYFTSLNYLNCSNNLLISITIPSPINITGIDASHNSLTTAAINFGGSDGSIDMSYNNLTTFTVPNNYHEDVDLSNNQLTSLTINDTYMDFFDVSHNNLSSIQVIGTPIASYNADFGNNQFLHLDLSQWYFDYDNSDLVVGGNDNLESFHFGVSQPTRIYFSSDNSTSLDFDNYRLHSDCNGLNPFVNISASPNLANVFFKNGYNHQNTTCDEGGNIFQLTPFTLNISSCPNLSFICVDEGEINFFQTRINQLGLQNQIQVNSYCSFTPGGTYYTINGNTQYDFNANGCDANDFPVPYQEFTITNGSETGTIISDASGNYMINVGAGTHTITPIVENASGFTISPANVSVNFPSQSSPLTQNFCIAATTPTHDFDITIVPLNPAVPGFDANYKIVYKNTGNVIDSGTIVLNFQDSVLDFISASTTPVSNSAGTLSWTFTNLMPFEIRTINLTFNLNGPMETPPLNDGNILNYTASIGETNETLPYSNAHSLNQMVVNSWDPNDKICLEGESLSNDFMGNYVSYRIRFENTGTYPAQNIVVRDVIDTTKFDISTLTPITGSHNFFTRITGNNVEFIFENINLPFEDATNDGYVVFKIKLLPGVIQNVPFSNQASIYFDYNFPIVTNTASSVIGVLGLSDFEDDNSFSIYPVPTQNVLNIESSDNSEIRAITIYNNLGQIIQKEIGNHNSIDVSRLTKGSYYLKIQTLDSSCVKQFLKE